MAPNPRKAHQRAESRPPQREPRAGRDDPRRSGVVALAPSPRGRSSSPTRMPDSASSAVVVLRAIVSWTCVLTRWSGRPNTTATAIRAGASSRRPAAASGSA